MLFRLLLSGTKFFKIRTCTDGGKQPIGAAFNAPVLHSTKV
jgi:hypothetical protein